MRGGPSQWTTGSQWIADGGIYPGMGDTIGLAGTSPELVETGLWNDGGSVGDPPFDADTADYFDSSVGAGSGGGYGGSYAGSPGAGGGRGDGMVRHAAATSAEDGSDDNPLVGLAIFGGVTLAFFWALHRFRVGDDSRFASIKGTAGDLAIIGVGAAFITPLVKTAITWAADVTDWDVLYDTASYVNAA